ncbi:TetR/AcrR family transcriptional regulator [Microbacterium betulae]|uniref:TetR/AcrR family transcriptional regulator n=1 Tax=Microbacterium betulae TaxID=2981139 RepID=A0AA97I5I5_9MICO|nr:TetR/AcrR family transcriptional regulator [Microbacterium sp. AB]WOF22137.1 TetR/AcrR family transcriptional regulator [Microbacterium sp. AB]
MSETARTGGLRERKRAATQAAIERAGLALVLERGYENVTVDMICEAATVSPRTFFNYFGSKEGVVLGALPPFPPDEAVHAFVRASGPSVLEDFLTMVTTALSVHEPHPELSRTRRLAIQRSPELVDRMIARMSDLEDQYAAVLLDRFAAGGRTPDAEPGLEDEARMVVGLAMTVLHYVMRKRRGSPVDAAGGREAIHDAIDLFRRATGDAARGRP